MWKGFSIITCCYNSAEKLRETVSYISRLDIPSNTSFELIIIDNNSLDHTLDIAQQLTKEYSTIDIVVDTELKSGKVHALSKALQMSRYKYIIICDDDNWLSHDYLHVALGLMERDDSIGIIGGMGVIKKEMVLPSWFTSLQNAWAVGKQADEPGEIKTVLPAVWGAGMVVRKSAWNEVIQRGFIGFLTGRKSDIVTMTGEDTELCIVVRQLGFKIFYEEKLCYTHDVSTNRLTWKSLKKLWEGFSRSSVYFDMYKYCFSLPDNDHMQGRRKLMQEFKTNLHCLFISSSILLSLRINFIAFIEDRPGYLPGLEKRKFLFRLKELWRIRKNYDDYLRSIAIFRIKL